MAGFRVVFAVAVVSLCALFYACVVAHLQVPIHYANFQLDAENKLLREQLKAAEAARKTAQDALTGERALGCTVLGRGAEPPQFWVLLMWLEPGISHVTWVHYDATMCLPCFVCSIFVPFVNGR